MVQASLVPDINMRSYHATQIFKLISLLSADIDEIIAEDIFKNEDEDGRRNAMLKLIELKSNMDDRVRELFQDNLQCKEEVEQIKNIYG